jgi:anti-sigma regulatory factor (Ser/Thr protein kinase)
MLTWPMTRGTGTDSACPPSPVPMGGREHDDSSAGTVIRPDDWRTVPEGWPLWSCLELGALPTAVSCARGHTRNVLWEWQLSHVAEDAEMLVSELATNGVKASLRQGAPVALRLLASRERLIIEVWDRNPDDPRPSPAGFESESGRGFTVIEALSSRWGFRRVNPGLKVVWAEMSLADGREYR